MFGLSLCLGWLGGRVPALAEPRTSLTQEHADFRVLYEPGREPALRIVARDEDHRIDYEGPQVVLLVPEAARLELPSGTPFGEEGQSLWILPQNQFADLLYLGFSAEQIPAGVFNGPLSFQLKQMVGPGTFFAWQAASFGEFLLKFNTADGIGEADRTAPVIGSHEHFNWGFSAPGVYALTFEIQGQRALDGQVVKSNPTTFLFHVLPLPPAHDFDTWWRQFFHPDLPLVSRGESADPDGDGIPNLDEFVLGSDPCDRGSGVLPQLQLEMKDGETWAVLQYQRRIGLMGGQGTAEIADRLEGPWIPALEQVESLPESQREKVRAMDTRPVNANSRRFFRIRWR